MVDRTCCLLSFAGDSIVRCRRGEQCSLGISYCHFIRIATATKILSFQNPLFKIFRSMTSIWFYCLINFFNPLSLSFASSNTSSGLHTANLSQSSTICAFASV